MQKSIVLLGSLLCLSLLYAEDEVVRKSDDMTVLLNRKTAVKTFVYENGKKETISLKGKTPYGVEIESVQKKIQEEPVPVRLIFSAEDSDENMSEELKLLFDDLYGTLRSRVGGSRYKGDRALDIVVSFCRYGEYGYCTKKRNNVYIRFVEDGTERQRLSLDIVYLPEKKKRVVFVQKVIKAFSRL